MRPLMQYGVAAGIASWLVLGVAPAGAATVSSTGGVLRLDDTQSESNAIYLYPPSGDGTTASGEVIVFSVDGPLTGGLGCVEARAEPPALAEFRCASSEDMTLDVHLGGSHDAIFAYPGVVYASATIDGGPGNDLLSIASAGTDEFIGGDGRDRVSYGYSDVGVTVTIDGQPNDGAPGEHDNVHTDVEAFDGGYGPDHLYGTDANDVIFGNSGDDVIVGVGGDDTLIGGGGADHLYGGPGQDQLDGAEGRPYQWHDTLDCGSGFDYTALDESDTHTACENGQYTLGPGTWWSSPFPPDTPPPAWMPPLSPIPAIASSGSVNPRAGVARLAVRCRSAKDACRGRLILQPAKRADKRRLGSARLRVARGRAKTVAVQLTAYGRQAVKRRHTLRAVAVVIPGGGGSARRTPVLLTVVR